LYVYNIFSEENKGSLTDSFSFAALAVVLVTTHNNPATISQQKQTKRDSNCFLTENRLSDAYFRFLSTVRLKTKTDKFMTKAGVS